MKAHAEFFRIHLSAAFGLQPLGSSKLAEWANTSSATLAVPAASGYPQALHSLVSLRPLFTFEAERFASAALESYNTVKTRWHDPVDRDGIAWRFVSLYYAAYYAAHAILRLCGISVTQVDNWNMVDLEFMTLYQSDELPALNLVSGYHVFRLDSSGTSTTITKAQIDSRHGTHTAVWSEFRNLAQRSYSNNSLNTTMHQTAAGEFSHTLSSPIAIEGNSIIWPWMPVIRNRINYRLPEQIWGAQTKRITPGDYKDIHNLIVSPTTKKIMDASGNNLEWLRFTGSCVYVLSLLCHLLKDMEIRATSKTFLPSFLRSRSDVITKLSAA